MKQRMVRQSLVGSALACCLPIVNAIELEEIIVTAQKIEQSIQDVPISVTAFSGDDLERSQVAKAEDIAQYTPGLSIGSVEGQVSPTYIRGNGTGQFDVGSDPAVAYFMDEVYITGNSTLQFELVDLARVEVLKGPQGTLFGRNASSGALAFYTQRPEEEFSGYISTELQSSDGHKIKANFTGPLVDGLVNYRVSAFQAERDGYMENLNPDATGNPGDQNQKGFRGALDFMVSDDIQLLLTADYGKSDNGMTMHTKLTPDAAFSVAGPVPVARAGEDFWHQYQNVDGYVKSDFHSMTATLDWSFDFADFKSITAYRSTENERLHDQDASALDAQWNLTGEETRSFSQELRLSSDSEKLMWVAGLYYYTADIDGTNDLNFGSVSALPGVFINESNSITVDSYALFGQAEYRFTNNLSLAVGGRYTLDKKTSDRTLDTNAVPVTFGPITIPAVAVDYDISVDDDWNDFSPMVSLNYTPNEDTLIYLSWRNGFKSGGFQSLALTQDLATIPFAEETVESWELGLKSELFDRRLRLNGSIFYVEYDDLQKSVTTDLGTILTLNAGKASSFGVDLSVNYAATENMIVSLNYGYLDAEYDEFQKSATEDFSGNKVQHSSENQLSLIMDYYISLGDLEIGLRGEYSYTDDWFIDSANTKSIDGHKAYQEAYGLINGRVSITPANNQWEVALWGKNLTDEEVCGHGIVQGTDATFGNAYASCFPTPPRTYGVTAKWNF